MCTRELEKNWNSRMFTWMGKELKLLMNEKSSWKWVEGKFRSIRRENEFVLTIFTESSLPHSRYAIMRLHTPGKLAAIPRLDFATLIFVLTGAGCTEPFPLSVDG